MDQDTAYKMLQGFARAGVSCHMQRTTDGGWDVVLDDRRLPAITVIRALQQGRDVWRDLRRKGLIAA